MPATMPSVNGSHLDTVRWPRGGVVTQRTANPVTPVRFRARPPALRNWNAAISAGRAQPAFSERVTRMTIDFAEQRLKMVDCQLRTTDVTSAAVLQAMGSVPREKFVPAAIQTLAYIDDDVAISTGEDGRKRHLMEPSPFAKLLQLAEISAGDVVLDVGLGTGYSSAVISLLAGSVIALECDGELAKSAMETLTELGYDSAVVVDGPLREGYASEAPFDVVFLNGAIEDVPDELASQLKDDGRIVGVLGGGNTGKATVWTKKNGALTARHVFNTSVPPLPGFQREAAFEF